MNPKGVAGGGHNRSDAGDYHFARERAFLPAVFVPVPIIELSQGPSPRVRQPLFLVTIDRYSGRAEA